MFFNSAGKMNVLSVGVVVYTPPPSLIHQLPGSVFMCHEAHLQTVSCIWNVKSLVHVCSQGTKTVCSTKISSVKQRLFTWRCETCDQKYIFSTEQMCLSPKRRAKTVRVGFVFRESAVPGYHRVIIGGVGDGLQGETTQDRGELPFPGNEIHQS